MAASDRNQTATEEPPHTGHQGGDFGGGSGFRRSVLMFLVVLVVVAAAYLLGRHQQSAELERAERQAEGFAQRLAEAQAAWGVAQDAARERIALLEARRQLQLGLGALQEHNFGMAQGHLRVAGLLVTGAQENGLHANTLDAQEDAEALALELREMRVDVTEDLEAQRERLQALVQRLDRLFPPVDPARMAEEPDTETALPELFPEALELPEAEREEAEGGEAKGGGHESE